MVAHALGTSEHRGVVGHGHHGVAVDLSQAGDHAVGRGVLDQIFLRAAAALGGYRQGTVLSEAAGIAQVGDVFTGATQALGVALGHGLRPAGVCREGLSLQQALQIGARGRGHTSFYRIIVGIFGL